VRGPCRGKLDASSTIAACGLVTQLYEHSSRIYWQPRVGAAAARLPKCFTSAAPYSQQARRPTPRPYAVFAPPRAVSLAGSRSAAKGNVAAYQVKSNTHESLPKPDGKRVAMVVGARGGR
jgi:hypothetical protein